MYRLRFVQGSEQISPYPRSIPVKFDAVTHTCRSQDKLYTDEKPATADAVKIYNRKGKA